MRPPCSRRMSPAWCGGRVLRTSPSTVVRSQPPLGGSGPVSQAERSAGSRMPHAATRPWERRLLADSHRLGAPRPQLPVCPCSVSHATNARTAPLTKPARIALRMSCLWCWCCSLCEGRPSTGCRSPAGVRRLAGERWSRSSLRRRGGRVVSRRGELGLCRPPTRSLFGSRATRDIKILLRVIRSPIELS